jgi:hypothetical protein
MSLLQVWFRTKIGFDLLYTLLCGCIAATIAVGQYASICGNGYMLGLG